ncbi:hypothetical protein [Mesonia sp. K4-1]|uniref:hypothetical protein n=1 Tax=Mesonia sp. K4-1 TaxID=2602760 RepID=UPI0011CC44E3|nr:hypothetical protein [Mesonia sp. K4-1]TXK78916.1 hypothetical protein FT986_03715 [Mesonia sp. K4-1]
MEKRRFVQLDFIKIRKHGVKAISDYCLVPHPRIKNRYKLDTNHTLLKQYGLFGEYIDIYLCNGVLTVSLSVPFFLNGHNFVETSKSDIEDAFNKLSEFLRVNLFDARVCDYEVAILHDSDFSVKELQSFIVGVDDMDLLKKDKRFIMYGNKKQQFKLYEVRHNLEKKMHPTVRKNFDFEDTFDCVKTEMKVSKPEKMNLEKFIKEEYEYSLHNLKIFIQYQIHVCFNTSKGEKFDDILFQTLLWAGKYTYKPVQEMALDIIDRSSLSPVQKSRRRKALRKKFDAVRQSGKHCFSDFLTDLNFGLLF